MVKHNPINALSAVRVRKEKRPGRYADGQALYLVVDPSGARRWVQRIVIRGKRTDLGIGGWPAVSLAEARETALANRKLAREGGDPRVERRRIKMPTFAEAAERVIALRRPDWRHPKTAEHWQSRLRTHAYPILMRMPIDQISSADVLRVLTPVWTAKSETARHVRGYMRDIFDWAIAHEYRTDNPAGDAVRLGLKRSRRAKIHFKAIHYSAAPAALGAVEASKARTATMLSFVFMVLTAARPGEVREARWEDIDIGIATWTIPAPRMKAEREHRVPLSAKAVKILEEAQKMIHNGSGLVFPSPTTGGPLSDNTHRRMLQGLGVDAVPHGFRSSFRDWAAECTDAPHAVMEAALAHVVPNATVAAYARSDLFNRRRVLMEQWADYLSQSLS